MSIQDKIFDIQAALEGKPEAEDFEEFLEHFTRLEEANIKLDDQYEKIRRAFQTFGKMLSPYLKDN